MEKNIFEGAYFGKPYKTRDGRKAIYLGNEGTSEFQHKLNIEGRDAVTLFNEFGVRASNNEDSADDIVSEWREEINEEEYEDKIKSLIESCTYWEAYEDLPELFAKSFKELLDFAPEDKRTIDYCAYLIKSKKTILNEIYSVLKF